MPRLLDVAPGLTLTGDGALLLRDHGALVVADVHVGYARAARRRGGWLPDVEPAEAAADRVCAAIAGAGATRVVVAGDLRHSTRDVDDAEMAEVRRFLARVAAAAPVHVVLGNHDRGGADAYAMAGVTVSRDALHLGVATVTHEPPPAPPDRWTVCGHLHPAVTLRDETGAGVRVPCAMVAARVVVLPAFGAWAGGVAGPRLRRALFDADWRAYAVAEGEVWPPM